MPADPTSPVIRAVTSPVIAGDSAAAPPGDGFVPLAESGVPFTYWGDPQATISGSRITQTDSSAPYWELDFTETVTLRITNVSYAHPHGEGWSEGFPQGRGQFDIGQMSPYSIDQTIINTPDVGNAWAPNPFEVTITPTNPGDTAFIVFGVLGGVPGTSVWDIEVLVA